MTSFPAIKYPLHTSQTPYKKKTQTYCNAAGIPNNDEIIVQIVLNDRSN